jgi:hypothetical protein
VQQQADPPSALRRQFSTTCLHVQSVLVTPGQVAESIIRHPPTLGVLATNPVQMAKRGKHGRESLHRSNRSDDKAQVRIWVCHRLATPASSAPLPGAMGCVCVCAGCLALACLHIVLVPYQQARMLFNCRHMLLSCQRAPSALEALACHPLARCPTHILGKARTAHMLRRSLSNSHPR